MAIAAGEFHSLALRADGSIVGWGQNYAGQASPPAGNGFVAIDAGWEHSLALLGTGAPGGFEKLTPPDGETGQEEAVRLSWRRALGVVSYDYCVDTTDDGACSGWVNVGISAIADLSGLANSSTYFWQVRAHNSFGTTEADEGTWWSFTTGPPGAFGKAAPLDGATGGSANTSLSWGAAPGATSYEYCLDATDDDACAVWVDAGTATSVAAERFGLRDYVLLADTSPQRVRHHGSRRGRPVGFHHQGHAADPGGEVPLGGGS